MNRKEIVKMFFAAVRLAVTATAVITTSTAMSSAGGYTVTDLGSGVAYSINNSGQAVGARIMEHGPFQAVLFNNGSVNYLGPNSDSVAYSINNAGQAVGYSAGHAVLFSGNSVIDIGLNGFSSVAYGINVYGEAVGSTHIDVESNQPFLYSKGSVTSLIPYVYGSYNEAFSINNSGKAVGSRYAPYNQTGPSAVLFSGGAMTELGALTGGTTSMANDINDSDQAVGWSGGKYGTDRHAALFSNGKVIDLGSLGGESEANSINNSGEPVGYSKTDGNERHAALFSNGKVIDLSSLVAASNGWALTDATDINDLGQIVVNGAINGQSHAFLLTPDTNPAIPIPAVLPLFGSGLALLGMMRRRKLA